MNYTINYSGFTEMFLDSMDDYEPYGCATASDYETISEKPAQAVENQELIFD